MLCFGLGVQCLTHGYSFEWFDSALPKTILEQMTAAEAHAEAHGRGQVHF